MASKHSDFELRVNLFNDVKVDENFCPHSVYSLYIFLITKVKLKKMKTTLKSSQYEFNQQGFQNVSLINFTYMY